MRATDTLFSTTAQFQILRVPTSSNGTTFGPGSNNNLLKSNGTSVYWTTLVASDIPTISITDKTSGTLPVNRGGTGVTAIANIQAGKDGDGNTISSTYLKLSGGTLTGNLTLSATSGNSPALIFNRDGGLTDWKIFVASGKLSFQSASNASTWTERASFADNSGNFTTTGTITATKFIGPLEGNVTGNVTGSSGSCTGNAATATTLSANATDTTKVFFRGDRTWSNVIKQTSNAALGIDTNLKIGTAKKDLNFTIANGSGSGINDGNAGGITWGDDNSAYAGIYYQTSGDYGSRLIFGTTNSYANGVYARMIITHEGKVGIGRLIPSSLLGVDGTITLTGDLNITNYLYTLSLVNDKYSGRQGLKSSGYGQYYDGTGISAMESEAWLVYRDASGNVILNGNAATATNADKVDNYHASSLWRSDGATWNKSANVSCTTDANNVEWSFDIGNTTNTGCYWQVWSNKNSNTILACYNDDRRVSIPVRLDTAWLRVVNNSSSNSDDAMVYLENKSNDDWALKINCDGYDYGINIVTSDNANHALQTQGQITCQTLWANQGSNGERQVGVSSATTGDLYMWANTNEKGIWSNGWMPGYVIRVTSSSKIFYGDCSGSAGSVAWGNISNRPILTNVSGISYDALVGGNGMKFYVYGSICILHIHGYRNGTIYTNTNEIPLLYIPSGYRPSLNIEGGIYVISNNTSKHIYIKTNGAVTIIGDVPQNYFLAGTFVWGI